VTASPLLVLELGGSALDLGVLAALQFGPAVLLSPLGGALADRVSRRSLLLWLHSALAVQVCVLAAGAASGNISVAAVLVISTVFGLATAAEMPIRLAFLAGTVPREHLPNAIVLHQAAFSTTRLLGPAAAGVLLLAVGFGPTLIVAAALALLAPWLLLATRPSFGTPAAAQGVRPFAEFLRTGVDYAWSTPAIRNLLIVVFGISAFGNSIQAILPLFAVDSLGMGSWAFGLLLSAFGTGGLLAAAPMTFISPATAGNVIRVALLCFATALLALAFAPTFVVAVGLLVVAGFCHMAVFGGASITVQSIVDDALRGRLMGLYIATWSAGLALGSLLVASVTEYADARIGLMLCAAGTLCVGLWAVLVGRGPSARTETLSRQ